MNLHRDKPDQYGNVVEDVTLTTLGRDGAVLKEFLKEIEALYVRRKDGLMRVYVQKCDEWAEFSRRKPRDLKTVILPEGVKNSLLSDMKRFTESEERYIHLGLPYRRGYLLHGPPGNGKSSLVEAIAGTLGYDLYVLSLSALAMTDQTLLQLMSNVPTSGICLIEDVDAAFNKEREKASRDGSSVTFSGLLNAIDGVGARPGQIVMMSTNHIERLDAALLRAGRSDVKLHIDNATPLQGMELFERFYPHSGLSYDFFSKLESLTDSLSMAALQAHLSSCESPQDALDKQIVP